MNERDDGGHVIPEAFLDDAVKQLTSNNLYRYHWFLRPVRPLTRGERIRGRLLNWRYRIEIAVEALRGRHECGYE
jgi:hypothetical protein